MIRKRTTSDPVLPPEYVWQETADVPTIVQAALAILNIIVALLGFGYVIWNIFWVIPQQRETQRKIDATSAIIEARIERMK